MGRATTQRVPRKPAAKAKESPEHSSTRGKSAKKKTSTSGIRVSLEGPHVAAAKPNAPATGLAVIDRAVLLPRAVVPLSDAAVAQSLVFGALVYGHVRDASAQGAVSIVIAGGGTARTDASQASPTCRRELRAPVLRQPGATLAWPRRRTHRDGA